MAEDINNSLFSQDELDSIQSAGYSRRPKGPVTVLGRTFNNDEERRAFFREELRKNSALKQGFTPIYPDAAVSGLSRKCPGRAEKEPAVFGTQFRIQRASDFQGISENTIVWFFSVWAKRTMQEELSVAA